MVIYGELISNFLLALAAVAVLSLLVLGKVTIVVLVCLTVVRNAVGLAGVKHLLVNFLSKVCFFIQSETRIMSVCLS